MNFQFAVMPLAAVVQEVAESAESITSFTNTWAGYAAVLCFVLAYAAVIAEERIHLRKSIPVMLGAGAIWAFVGIAYMLTGDLTTAAEAVRDSLSEFAELFLFILSAMTFVATMEERQVFDALRAWLVGRGFTLRQLFWVTGIMTFFISSQLDNLTTSLIMGAVVITVGRGFPKFVAIACISTVVAANAGGAWSAFGDITTLMVWQAGRADFFEFYRLILPSAVNWLVPALIMSFALPSARPPAASERVELRRGAWGVIGLFALTIVMAVTFYNVLGLPPALGMTTGLGLLKLYGYLLTRSAARGRPPVSSESDEPLAGFEEPVHDSFDVFDILRRAEWDTLMFFFGIIVAVGGLATLGYLAGISAALYGGFGPTIANIAVGVISSIVDNIPVVYAVISMDPNMPLAQWLLVTLTAGVGGSLLAVGSAAGVALMGQARGAYTFFSHLKWTWAIALGYGLSIWVHLLINH